MLDETELPVLVLHYCRLPKLPYIPKHAPSTYLCQGSGTKLLSNRRQKELLHLRTAGLGFEPKIVKSCSAQCNTCTACLQTRGSVSGSCDVCQEKKPN